MSQSWEEEILTHTHTQSFLGGGGLWHKRVTEPNKHNNWSSKDPNGGRGVTRLIKGLIMKWWIIEKTSGSWGKTHVVEGRIKQKMGALWVTRRYEITTTELNNRWTQTVEKSGDVGSNAWKRGKRCFLRFYVSWKFNSRFGSKIFFGRRLIKPKCFLSCLISILFFNFFFLQQSFGGNHI